ncbi:MAG: hypothetical protein ILP10_08220 [Lachnospiraceae bacterium]|nr:hypothetical protein [Lachnospiraceae bacterium]
MKRKRHVGMIVLIAVLALVLLILCAGTIICAVKFGTCNFPKVISALDSIANGNIEYVEIKPSPNKVVLASPEQPMQSFEGYIAANGYTIAEEEQLGSMIVITKGEKKEIVHFSANKYYSLWQWEDNP